MKNTITKGIFTCILASTLALGIGACGKEEPIQEPKSERQVMIEKDMKEGVKIKEIQPEDSGKVYKLKESLEKNYESVQISTWPESKTGQTLEVFIRTWDGDWFDGDLWNVKEMKLYEDGKIVEIKKGNDDNRLEGLNRAFKHEEPGTHSYKGEFIYENDVSKETETIQVKFTGEILDLPPHIASITLLRNELFISAYDEGDNKGIIHYTIYEDGEVLENKSFEPDDWVYVGFPLSQDKEGKHKYHAVFTDRGGNKISTEAITIDYD